MTRNAKNGRFLRQKKTRKKQIVHAHQKLENSTLLTEFLHCLELMVRKRQATRWPAASVVTGLSEPGGYGPSRLQQINQPYLNQGGILCKPQYYLSSPPTPGFSDLPAEHRSSSSASVHAEAGRIGLAEMSSPSKTKLTFLSV